NTLAFGVPSSSFSRSVPAVAVYLISCPPIRIVCLVCTVFSSGFFSSFFSSFLSPDFSPLSVFSLLSLLSACSEDFSPGFCAHIGLGFTVPSASVAPIKNEINLAILSSPELHGTCNSNAHRILCDSPRRVNLSALPDDETEIQQTFDLLSTNAKGAWSKFVVGILDTSWYTRYRSSSHNPDLHPGFIFPQAVPDLHNGQHTAIPRTDADTGDPNFLQAIVNTAVSTSRPSNRTATAFILRSR